MTQEEKRRQIEHDDLTQIKGVSPTRASALNEIGIYRFEDLLQYEPDSLSEQLCEQTDVPLTAKQVADWFAQARELVEATSSADKAKVSELESDAGFPVESEEKQENFEIQLSYRIENQNPTHWRTRIFHRESQDNADFSGFDILPWVSWMMPRAKLPLGQQLVPVPVSQAVDEPSRSQAAESLQVNITEVKVLQDHHDLSSQQWVEDLIAEIKFQISGPKVSELPDTKIPVLINFYTLDETTHSANLSFSKEEVLAGQERQYIFQYKFSKPNDIGKHECHTLLLLLPPYTTMATFVGPTIRVVP